MGPGVCARAAAVEDMHVPALHGWVWPAKSVCACVCVCDVCVCVWGGGGGDVCVVCDICVCAHTLSKA